MQADDLLSDNQQTICYFYLLNRLCWMHFQQNCHGNFNYKHASPMLLHGRWFIRHLAVICSFAKASSKGLWIHNRSLSRLVQCRCQISFLRSKQITKTFSNTDFMCCSFNSMQKHSSTKNKHVHGKYMKQHVGQSEPRAASITCNASARSVESLAKNLPRNWSLRLSCPG